MKKSMLLLISFVLIFGLVAALPVASTESEFYYVNVQILKIFPHKLGYYVIYRRAGLKTGEVYIPQKWFDRRDQRAGKIVNGTVQDNISLIDGTPEITFIDAIHTRDFVMARFALVKSIAAPGALVIFDDIDFSADMKACWTEIAADPPHQAVRQIGKRVGTVELPSPG